jgi:hypothetical protein
MGGLEPARQPPGHDHVEDVLNSRMIAYPFRLLQCCLVTDGGGALILIAAEGQELLRHTSGGRYPWQKWVPACAGKTSKRVREEFGRRVFLGHHSSTRKNKGEGECRAGYLILIILPDNLASSGLVRFEPGSDDVHASGEILFVQ